MRHLALLVLAPYACGDSVAGGAVDAVAPVVLTISPADGAAGLSTDTVVTVTFSEPMDPATITAAALALQNPYGDPIASAIAVGADARAVTIIPDPPLEPGHTITTSVAVSVADLAGNPLGSPFSASFDTRAPTFLESLAGSWTLDAGTCGGVAPLEGPFDGTSVTMTLGADTLDFELGVGDCRVSAAMNLTYDEGRSAVSATTAGNLKCVPAACHAACGTNASTVVPGFSGAVTVAGESLTVTGDDPALFPLSHCGAVGLGGPSVHTFDRGRRRTYYVATDEPGASNEQCDGLAPTDEGDGRCPFKDFTSPRTAMWRYAKDLEIVVKPGTYHVEQHCRADNCTCGVSPRWDFAGIWIQAQGGLTEEQRVVLRGDDTDGDVILQGGQCSLTCCDYPGTQFDGQPLVLLEVSGQRVDVSGFTFRDAAYHNVVVGARHTNFSGNTLYPPTSDDGDSLKGGGVTDVRIADNVFDGFNDQAIDIAGFNERWVIETNVFANGNNGALGGKCGTRDVTFRNNTIRDLSTLTGQAMAAVGSGPCSITNHYLWSVLCGDPAVAPCYSIANWQIHGNVFENLSGAGAGNGYFAAMNFYSCDGCQFFDNTIDGADVAIVTQDFLYGDPMDPGDWREHPAISPSVDIGFYDNDIQDISLVYYVFMDGSVDSLGQTTGNRTCVDPAVHPSCGNDAGDAGDAVLHPNLTSACMSAHGAGTFAEAEALLGDLGTSYWSVDCPF